MRLLQKANVYFQSLDAERDSGLGYGFNGILIGSHCRPRTLSSLRNSPTEVAVLGDYPWPIPVGDPTYYPPCSGPVGAPEDEYWRWSYWVEGSAQIPVPDPLQPRHQGGNNFVYADGHARFARAILLGEERHHTGARALFGYYERTKLE
jgi:prepilin-type processing-associated H-X9-DG protein